MPLCLYTSKRTYRTLYRIYGCIDGVYVYKQNTKKYPELSGVVVEGFNNKERNYLGENNVSFYCRNAIFLIVTREILKARNSFVGIFRICER